ncbi:MAG: signal peptide prediction, partial [Blastopirellula sp.]
MSQNPLRIIGTPDTLIEAIRNRAESDLGFPISFEPLDGLKLQQRVVMSPDSFDVMDHWSISAELAWAARAIQPIELDRIEEWQSILHEGSEPSFLESICIGKGAAPGRKLFVQDDLKLGQDPTKVITMLPTVHNFDSFCYRPHLRYRYFPDKREESWGWLLEPEVRGRVALSSHAPIAIIEAALAIEARQLMKFNDIGNLTISEIDRIIDILIELKRRRHFRGFWDSTEEAVNLMNQKDTDFASIWAQGFYQLKAKNNSIAFAVPKEGYRGWM